MKTEIVGSVEDFLSHHDKQMIAQKVTGYKLTLGSVM